MAPYSSRFRLIRDISSVCLNAADLKISLAKTIWVFFRRTVVQWKFLSFQPAKVYCMQGLQKNYFRLYRRTTFCLKKTMFYERVDFLAKF